MAGRVGNKTWLRQQLQKALQWDADAAEALVEAVAVAGSRDEVDGLVDAYMGGNQAARQLVMQFCGPASGAAAVAEPPGMQMLQRDDVRQQLQSPAPARAGGMGGASGSRPGSSGSSGGRGQRGAPPPQTMELQAPAEKPKPNLYMGPNVRTTVQPARRKGRGGAAAAAAAGSSAQAGGDSQGGGARELQKLVVNCLGCGKIYDCRKMGDEARRFLDSGGMCTFCGRLVTLRYADGTTNAAPDTAADTAGEGSGSGTAPAGDLAGFEPESQQSNAAGSVAYNASAAAAVALKNRLVEYDRESAKRTSVYDDQEDYFSIDANAWLTDEERAVLKARERAMAEAEEARRKRVTVSFDLLGRKVVMEDGGRGAAPEQVDAAQIEAELEEARKVAAVRAAAAATAAEAAQGGGSAAPTALAAVEDKLRDLRITVNPSMAARHFVFLPKQQEGQQQQGQQQPRAGGASQAPAMAAGGSAGQAATGGRRAGGKGQQQRPQQQRKGPASKGPSRLQHDDPFDWDMGYAAAEVIAADEAGRHALEKAGMLA